MTFNMTSVETTTVEASQPESMDLTSLFSVIYGVICVCGLICNGLVMFVIWLQNSPAHSVTNAYIVNLAVADSCFLVGLPFLITTATVRRWIFGHVCCKLFFTLTSVNWFTSVFTLTVMAVDRYLAVCHPIASRDWRTSRLSRVVCACIWLVSLLAMLPIMLFATVLEQEGVQSCTLNWPDAFVDDPWTAFIIYACLLGFALPVATISVFYALVVCRLSRAPIAVSSTNRGRSRNRVTRLVLTIIALYVTCWLPYWVFQVTTRFFSDLPAWGLLLYQAITVLSYANSIANPLLYALFTENFRQSLAAAFGCARRQSMSTRSSPETRQLHPTTCTSSSTVTSYT